MSDRCSGHCCKRFLLPYSPEELKARQDRLHQGDIIVPMAIFLEKSDLGADGKRGNVHYWYTCKNFQPDGNCAIYETRPEMCSEYPYGAPCKYTECTWDAGKEGSWPLTVLQTKEVHDKVEALVQNLAATG